MICSKPFTLEITAGPAILAWWTMDLGIPSAELDSVNNVAFNGILNVGFLSSVPGIVSNGLQFAPPSAGVSVISQSTADASVAFTGDDVTVCLWINASEGVGAATSFLAFNYRFTRTAITYNISLERLGATGTANWTLEIDNHVNVATLPSALGWHFFVIKYNTTTGSMTLAIDQAASDTKVQAVTPAGVNTSAFIFTGISSGVPLGSSANCIVDEVAVFDGALDTAALDYLYNAGAGRTYPP